MMRPLMKTAILASTAFAATFTSAPMAQAQTSHGIAAVVNDDIITSHDLRQRVLFMLATTGVDRSEESVARVQAQALRNLVDEKIQAQRPYSVARLESLSPFYVCKRLLGFGNSRAGWRQFVSDQYEARLQSNRAPSKLVCGKPRYPSKRVAPTPRGRVERR